MLKYFSLYGTTQRKEYWLTSILYMIAVFVLTFTMLSVEALMIPALIVLGVFIWMGAALTIKRVRDTGCSGWFLLLYSILAFIPYLGFVAQVIWMCLPSNFFDRYKQK